MLGKRLAVPNGLLWVSDCQHSAAYDLGMDQFLTSPTSTTIRWFILLVSLPRMR